MTTYGVTPAGFFPKTVQVLISEISTALGTLVYDPTSPEGQVVGAVAEKLGELWELLAVAFNSMNRDDAEGFLLDNVGIITGTLRQTPKPSFVFATCTLAAGTYPAGSLVAFVPATPSEQWSNALDVVLTSPGSPSVLFVSAEDGPVQAFAGTMTGMVPVAGWTAVTNPLDATPGALLEEDEPYRLRQEEELSAAGASTLDAIKADLLTLSGVVSVKTYENTTMVVDGTTGLPAKSFMALVWDQGGLTPDQSIGQVIWDSKPAGIQDYGATSVTVVDSSGQQQTAFFQRPNQRNVYMALTVTLAAGATIGAVAPLVKQAIVGLPALEPGDPVIALKYRAAALNVAGVTDVPAMALDFVPSPVATANLTVGPLDIALLDTSRITVNGI